jgi:AcrR family transcriptional regulator
MPEEVKRRRPYRSGRRLEQAAATRRSVLDAALDLFTERGYAASSMDAIAARAGVSAETVYAAFRNKRTLLARLVDVAIAGDAAAPPVMDQHWVEELRQEPDVRRRIRILAANGRAILERRAAVDEIVRGAATADPEIAELYARGRAERFAGQRALLQLVVDPSGRGGPADLDELADAVYAIGSPDTWRSLVIDRDWSGDRFERWYGDMLERLLLG